MTPIIEQEARSALRAQIENLPRIRREVVASLTEDNTAAEVLQLTTRACCDAGLRMTKKQFSDFFETVFKARQEHFPHRLIFNLAGI
ncbi:MAG: hypothetical protein P1U75_05780 [Antarcticimicrobium sp.]|uniref:hypothetical protein n=1 Tax=Antarcticimicrobium sp. TaxID=2824147 RepID=UPI00260789D5|nr:hypothetical protein [Antarcticimicrobium sp.]MDF1716167.1 hypothetical protein [Antarcticimicrobium sp.]